MELLEGKHLGLLGAFNMRGLLNKIQIFFIQMYVFINASLEWDSLYQYALKSMLSE